MEIRRLPATETAAERYAAALWLPYHRDLVAFVSTSVDECPTVFDRPDRLVVGDIYVAEPYRGTGIAGRLMERTVIDAREQDCGELRLDVDNGRAMAFYETPGFEPYRKQLTRDVE